MYTLSLSKRAARMIWASIGRDNKGIKADKKRLLKTIRDTLVVELGEYQTLSERALKDARRAADAIIVAHGADRPRMREEIALAGRAEQHAIETLNETYGVEAIDVPMEDGEFAYAEQLWGDISDVSGDPELLDVSLEVDDAFEAAKSGHQSARDIAKALAKAKAPGHTNGRQPARDRGRLAVVVSDEQTREVAE